MTPRRSRQGAALTLVIALVAIIAGGFFAWRGYNDAPEQFYFSYLVAWLYWLGPSLGSLLLLLLHNLSGGKWGDLIRPILRAAAWVLPLMALLSLPIVLQPEKIYEWANPSHVEHDPILQHKAKYLNVEFFQIRAAIYFALWIVLLFMLSWQARVSPIPDTAADRRFRRFSGQGLAVSGIAVTFAAVDWVMSLEPHWFSMIFGVIWFAGWGLNALAFANLIAASGARRMAALEPYHVNAMHDLGKLMLGFTMFWAYVTFSQFLIIWYGNLPEEVGYFIKRIEGPWQWTALAMVILHFILPFCLLLSARWKRDPSRLAAVALILLVGEWVSVVWQVQPAVLHGRPSMVPWLDLAITAVMGGVWWIAFMILLPRVSVRVTAGSGEIRHG